MKRNRQKGFSLIELLIVVAIILIIAAIAIPNLVRAKMQANQASAVASLRTINTAEVVYSTTYPTGYSPTLVSLGDTANQCPGTAPTGLNACLIDNTLAQATATAKSGYTFLYTPGAASGGTINTYTIIASPASLGSSGLQYFWTDQTNVIHHNTTGTISPTDPSI